MIDIPWTARLALRALRVNKMRSALAMTHKASLLNPIDALRHEQLPLSGNRAGTADEGSPV